MRTILIPAVMIVIGCEPPLPTRIVDAWIDTECYCEIIAFDHYNKMSVYEDTKNGCFEFLYATEYEIRGDTIRIGSETETYRYKVSGDTLYIGAEYFLKAGPVEACNGED